MDITDEDAVHKIIADTSPQVIINAAAYTAVDQAEQETREAWQVNRDAPGYMAKAARPDTLVIHVSTDFVFSSRSNRPWQPGDPASPTSVYGKSKLAGEQRLFKFHPDNSVVLRTSWLYSASGKNFVTTMLRLMHTRDSLKVINDQYGSPSAASTLAGIIWRFATRETITGVFHWSDHGVISWYDFALEIQRMALESGLLNREIPVTPVPTSGYPTAATRPVYSALDACSTEQLLGVNTIPWQQQLAKVLEEIKIDKEGNQGERGV